MTLENNPLSCECANSYYMNQWSLAGIQVGNLDPRQLVFVATCQQSSDGANLGHSVINFGGYSACQSGYYMTSCPTTTVGTTTVTTITSTTKTTSTNAPIILTTTTTKSTTSVLKIAAPQNQYGDPAQAQLGVGPVSTSLYDGYIAGIILAFLFLLVLLFIIFYMLCPIECYTCCFYCFPCFYKICPCKSGHKRDKEYDLFISYNQENRKWVQKRFVPFINGKISSTVIVKKCIKTKKLFKIWFQLLLLLTLVFLVSHNLT
jgi:hypothetical protein